ncbi:hypothetical protein D3C87_991350 [compost metagenome]
MANQILIKNTMQEMKDLSANEVAWLQGTFQSIRELSYWAITKKEIHQSRLCIISLQLILDRRMVAA